jgi:hypothetical protein
MSPSRGGRSAVRTDADGSKVAWFEDPDGNLFSVEGDR